MRLLILGGSRKTRNKDVREALDAGYVVTAFVRNAAKLVSFGSRLKVIASDVFDRDSLSEALVGQDALISTLGTVNSSEQLLLRSTKAIIDGAAATGLRRVIMMSSFFMAPEYKPGVAVKLLTGLFMKGVV